MIVLAVLNGSVLALVLFALASAFAHFFKLESWKALAAGFLALGVLGMLQFWVTFFDSTLTFPVQTLVLGTSAGLIAWVAWHRRQIDIDLIIPCAATMVGAAVLIAWAMQGADAEDRANLFRFFAQRWTIPLPGDNELPYVFANQLRMAQIATPFYGDWLSSDRPPLQTGLYLLLNVGGPDVRAYQTSSTAIQMLALPAIWMLARSLGTSRLWSALAMLALWVTPLAIVNGIFVWPKMIAGAYVCGAAAIQFGPSNKKRNALDGILAGGSAALAMLAHGATAFILVGFVFASLMAIRVFSWRYLITAAAIAGALYLPWIAYQRFYDPPGDRLMKWHLAGVIDLDKRSLGEALADSYSSLTVDSWIDGRMQNVSAIFANPVPHIASLSTAQPFGADYRNMAFRLVPIGMGLFGLFLYAVMALAIFKPIRSLAVSVVAGLSVWALLLFQPGETIAHQGSFFPQMAIIAMATWLFSSRPILSKIGLAFLALHIVLMAAIHAAS